MVTYKDYKEQVNDALSSYRKEFEIDKLDPEVIFIDAFSAAFNLDKMPSKAAMEEILLVALNGDGKAVDDALVNIEKHYFK